MTHERAASDERAALHRVATLVAAGAGADELFAAVAGEVARALGEPTIMLARFEPEGDITVLASVDDPVFKPGTRWPLDGPSVVLAVRDSGRPARIEDYTDVTGTIAAGVRDSGIRAAAGVPIIVNDAVWGVIRVATRSDEPLPGDAAERLVDMSDLLAIAITHAESRDRERRLVQQQEALRRVAMLVAGGGSIEFLCRTVVDEIVQVLEVETASVEQAAPEGWLTVLASVSLPRDDPSFAAGTKWRLDGVSGSGRVITTGRPVRIDDYSELPGTIAERARRAGLASSISLPILVDGSVWGVVGVGQTARQRLAMDTEVRLHDFTSLVATAISNAHARERIRRLADEQAALRRVATHVAEGAPPEEVFKAVGEEVAGILGAATVRIAREASDRAAVVVVSLGEPATEGESLAAPILVDDRVWGTITVGGFSESVPPDASERLAAFTELVATAIANAESRGELAASEARARALAEEQAALRRVATLVAGGATPARVFDAVRDEVAHMFKAPVSALYRFDSDGMATVVASAGNEINRVGSRWPLEGTSTAAAVYRTGRTARTEYDESARGTLAKAALADGSRHGIGAPIVVDGALWGSIMVGSRNPEPLPAELEHRLAKFTELLAMAIANAESRAEVDASRARIVATADATRQRIGRDLHDGIQQGLVALALRARKAAALAAADEWATEELSGLADDLVAVTDELREISHGIHPAILSHAGLDDALETLARRSAIRVELDVGFEGRYDPMLEATVYYVAAESITNAVKHAQASSVTLRGGRRGRALELEIMDDGVGGADPRRGTGLIGLRDRVDTLGGTISFVSQPGAGTAIRMKLPARTGEEDLPLTQ
jgi:signal transduction histidine kinase